MTGAGRSAQDSVLALMGDPRRRAVYEYALAAARPVTRDEVADGVGLSRASAAFHLDRLAEAAVMSVSFARPPGRGGPGAGRPAKRYAAHSVDLEVSVPPRRYRELVEVLTDTVANLDDESDRFMRRAREAAFARGRQQAEEGGVGGVSPIGRVSETLTRLGYLADRSEPRRIVLRNCPFRGVSDTNPEVVCTLNERYVAGVIAGLGLREQLRVVGDGVAPACCVTVAVRS